MTNKPQWQGVTLYLVTTNKQQYFGLHDGFIQAAHEWDRFPAAKDAHVWEVQIGQAPVDVTDEARKLVEGK